MHRMENGRSTLSEGYLIKIKQYADYEAVAVGVEELQHGTHDRNKISGNTLGAIVAKTANGTVFKIKTGYTAEERRLIWINKHNLIERYIKYKCAKQDTVPHSAVFLGIRHQDDMSSHYRTILYCLSDRHRVHIYRSIIS